MRAEPAVETTSSAHITVQDLTMAYGDFVIQRDLTFTIRRGDIFIISKQVKHQIFRIQSRIKSVSVHL